MFKLLPGFLLAAGLVVASNAYALDVNGNWSITGATVSEISSVGFEQTGTTLTACVSGVGTVATGTVDEMTGAFMLVFDTNLITGGEFGLCGLEWSGTFALDGSGLTGSEADSPHCNTPFPCCAPVESRAIGGTRSSTEVVCCGNGAIEGSEVCDSPPNGGESCCAHDCSFATSGTFCGADDQCHLKECDGAGVCVALPPVDCGACQTCDNDDGCVVTIRNDCSVGGPGSRLRVKRPNDSTSLDWRWREGAGPETVLADFGNPLSATSYELCVFTFDIIPAGFLRYPALIAHDQDCSDRSCWKQKASGFRYGSGTGTPNGIKNLQLKAASDGRSALQAKAKGVSLFPPLADPLVVQLSANDGSPSRCWSNTFTSPSRNDITGYEAEIP